MTAKNTVSDDALDEAYTIMARIIRDHGDKYLPVFKRLYEEKERRKANRNLIDKALQAAQNRVE